MLSMSKALFGMNEVMRFNPTSIENLVKFFHGLNVCNIIELW